MKHEEPLTKRYAVGTYFTYLRNKRSRFSLFIFHFSLFILLFLTACAPTRFLDEDEHMLSRVSMKCDDHDLPLSTLSGYIRQHPNVRWFNLLKVPLGIYCISGTDSTRSVNRFFRRLGEAPVVFDSTQTEKGRQNIEAAVRNLGYLNASVEVEQWPRNKRMDICYRIHPGECYTVGQLSRQIDDSALDSAIVAHWTQSVLHKRMPFDVNLLDRERTRITSQLQNDGYYRFSKNYVRFDADTNVGGHEVDLTLRIPRYQPSPLDSLQDHRRYYLARVDYSIDSELTNDTPPLRPSFLANKTMLRPRQVYRESDAQGTYANLSSLSAVMATNVSFEPVPLSPDSLAARVTLHMARRHGVSSEIEIGRASCRERV